MRTLTAEDRTRAIPVLMLSNSSRQQDGQRVVRLEAIGCSEANLSLQELGDRVAQLWGPKRMEQQTTRILLVEDDCFLRKAAEATLRRHGFNVCTAVDGEEALQRLQAESPDLMLLDLIMPKMQGFEVLRLMKQNSATMEIPVVVLSNLGQESDVQQALQGAPSPTSLKPISPCKTWSPTSKSSSPEGYTHDRDTSHCGRVEEPTGRPVRGHR